MNRDWIPLAIIIIISTALAPTHSLEVAIQRDAKQAIVDVPFVVDVTGRLNVREGITWQLEHTVGRTTLSIPCQLMRTPAFGHRNKLLLCFTMPARTYALRVPGLKLTERMQLRSASVKTDHQFQWEDNERGNLTLREGERIVLVYNYGDVQLANAPASFKRSSYVHPLYDLDGVIITDDFPRDHLHHRGLWWSFPHVIVDGKDYNLWALRGIRHRFIRWLQRDAGVACALLGVANQWCANGKPIVNEQAWLWIFKTGAIGRVIDVELRWEAIDRPVIIRGADGKGYGGLCIRFAPRQMSSIVTPEGRLNTDVNSKRFLWADFSAQFRNSRHTSGVAMFYHPANPGHPSPWVTRYYGLLNPCYPGMDGYTLTPKRPLILRYRLWIHRGNAEFGRVAEAYQVYVNPPTAHIIHER